MYHALRYVATDGDAFTSRGVQDAMPAVPTERQADTAHLGQIQFRHIMKASFSPPEYFQEKQPPSEHKTEECLLKI